jgi:simple sugar transport system ATP-binding protein
VTSAAPPAVRLRAVAKSFGPVRAVDGVDLELRRGETLALLGENGAGKSTLMKLLYGVHQPERGAIELDGRPVALTSPAVAIAHGIGMVFQRFTLVPALSVLDNLLLAWPRTRWRLGGEHAAVLARLTALAPGLDPRRRVAELSVAERQLVELVRVLNMDARCVLLDEPTAVLTPLEVERLYELIRPLAREGRAVVMITHKLADVAACADRVVVMRQGRLVDDAPAGARSEEALVRAMIGTSEIADDSGPPPVQGRVRLLVRGLAVGEVREVAFEVAAGEVLGVAGVAGNGQRALAEALAGVQAPSAGEALLDGRSLLRREGAGGLDPRVAYIPEQPLDNGVAAALSATVNVALRRLRALRAFPDWRAEAGVTRALMERFDVRPLEPRLPVHAFSGGNLQKLVLARELSGTPDLVVACYPTMGLDVAATRAVHGHLLAAAARGASVVWFSEELDELLRFAHRIAVMREGRIVGVLPREGASRQALGRLMAGSTRPAA